MMNSIFSIPTEDAVGLFPARSAVLSVHSSLKVNIFVPVQMR